MPEFSINHSITYVIKKTNCHILLHMKITLVFTCDLGRRPVRPNLCTLYIHRVKSTGTYRKKLDFLLFENQHWSTQFILIVTTHWRKECSVQHRYTVAHSHRYETISYVRLRVVDEASNWYELSSLHGVQNRMECNYGLKTTKMYCS